MAKFDVAKQFTKDLEGGFWNDPSAGYTYAGITAKYFPGWKGWAYLKKIAAAKYGSLSNVPRYTKFPDRTLQQLVDDFYKQNHWLVYVKGDQFQNQDMANLVYDFIVHKQNDAIGVINEVAKSFNRSVRTSKDTITNEVIATLNNNMVPAYAALYNARINYYQGSKKFSAAMKAAFVDRVKKFPASIKSLSSWLTTFSSFNFSD